ncbi:MAG: recombinase family protein [Hormoscilla sp. GM102CHS1]|nr:recombinase family protein [Hormoscilla sp. GM102CHS1]
MKIIAYSYCDPLLEPPLDPGVWGWEVDRVYTDAGGRQQLQQMLSDCRTTPATYLLIRRWEELGDSVEEVNSHLEELGCVINQIA